MAILSICKNPDLLKVILIVKNIINIMKIVVPLILIVFLMLDLTKGITSDKEDKVMASIKIIPRKLIAAALFFLIPTILDVTLNVMDENLNIEYVKCITNAKTETIEELYLSNAEELVTKAESSLNKLDVYDAKIAIGKIKTNDDDSKESLKDSLESRLKIVSDKVYESSNNNSNESNSNNNTSTSYDFPDYSQCGEWSTLKLSNGKKYDNCHCGCGTTALAMIASGLNNDSSITPASVLTYISGYTSMDCGTSENSLRHGNITNKYNIQPTTLFGDGNMSEEKQKEKIVSELKLGRPIILHVPGHYVVLTKISNDKITVQDPGRKNEYNGNYTIDELFKKFGDYKQRCSNPEKGKSKNCGFHGAISYYKL